MRAGRIVALGLSLLPLCRLMCQEAPARLQSAAQKGPSSSTLVLTFGPTASNAEGKAAADKLLQALGGSAKVNAVKTLRQTVVALQQGQRTELEHVIVYPDARAAEARLSKGTWSLAATPTDAFVAMGGQVRNLDTAQRAGLNAVLKRDFLNVLRHINDPKYIFAATGQEKVGEAQATVVDVDADGAPTRWWIGSDGKLLQERYSNIAKVGGPIQTTKYSDWKDFDGLKYPTKWEVFNEAGQPLFSMTLTRMEINPRVEPKLLQKPAGN